MYIQYTQIFYDGVCICRLVMAEIVLFLHDIPAGYGLFNVNKLIEKILGDPDGLRSVDYAKRENGTNFSSVAEIHLRTRECRSILIVCAC